MWLQKGAEQGDTIAPTKLGILYLIGRGIARDDSTTAKWLFKTAEQGHHEAQAKLALLHEKGRGVPHDLNGADFWQLLSLDGSSSKQSDEIRDLARYMNHGESSGLGAFSGDLHFSRREDHPDLSQAH